MNSSPSVGLELTSLDQSHTHHRQRQTAAPIISNFLIFTNPRGENHILVVSLRWGWGQAADQELHLDRIQVCLPIQSSFLQSFPQDAQTIHSRLQTYVYCFYGVMDRSGQLNVDRMVSLVLIYIPLIMIVLEHYFVLHFFMFHVFLSFCIMCNCIFPISDCLCM